MTTLTVDKRPHLVRLALFACLIGASLWASNAAYAQHRHGWGGPRVGIYFGSGYIYPRPYYSPFYYSPFYYPPAYYYPPAVVVPAQPPVYIERPAENFEPAPAPAPQAQAQASAYYFCAASNAYYPYVRECPGGWQQVAPQPGR